MSSHNNPKPDKAAQKTELRRNGANRKAEQKRNAREEH